MLSIVSFLVQDGHAFHGRHLQPAQKAVLRMSAASKHVVHGAGDRNASRMQNDSARLVREYGEAVQAQYFDKCRRMWPPEAAVSKKPDSKDIDAGPKK